MRAIGYQKVKAQYTVPCGSVLGRIHKFLHNEVREQEVRTLAMYLKAELLIINDMEMKQLPRRPGEYLFEMMMRRDETRSAIITSN